MLLQTDGLDHVHQAYPVQKIVPYVLHFFPFESLLDYNVFHVKQDHHGISYIAVKYDINYMHCARAFGRK